MQDPTTENGRALILAREAHSFSICMLAKITLEDAILYLSERLSRYHSYIMLEWGVRSEQPYTEQEIQAAIPAASRVVNHTIEERYGVPKHYITLVYFEGLL